MDGWHCASKGEETFVEPVSSETNTVELGYNVIEGAQYFVSL
jgi:hypothetical protein